eukprot:TRINITY_DN3158_c0_g1_i1.p4 TRINITY_DN3158_c0_g1~~TRINITY_DN3158_c0_g1_i1.p4  ORF type:complete len:109 (-),score=0.13 TRINITY_DN3158_c0_g1_i1:408-734(-)
MLVSNGVSEYCKFCILVIFIISSDFSRLVTFYFFLWIGKSFQGQDDKAFFFFFIYQGQQNWCQSQLQYKRSFKQYVIIKQSTHPLFSQVDMKFMIVIQRYLSSDIFKF